MNIVKWMLNYQIFNWKKLKTAVKDKTGTTWRMSLKMLAEDELAHELLLTKRQKIKLKMLLIKICQLT